MPTHERPCTPLARAGARRSHSLSTPHSEPVQSSCPCRWAVASASRDAGSVAVTRATTSPRSREHTTAAAQPRTTHAARPPLPLSCRTLAPRPPPASSRSIRPHEGARPGRSSASASDQSSAGAPRVPTSTARARSEATPLPEADEASATTLGCSPSSKRRAAAASSRQPPPLGELVGGAGRSPRSAHASSCEPRVTPTSISPSSAASRSWTGRPEPDACCGHRSC